MKKKKKDVDKPKKETNKIKKEFDEIKGITCSEQDGQLECELTGDNEKKIDTISKVEVLRLDVPTSMMASTPLGPRGRDYKVVFAEDAKCEESEFENGKALSCKSTTRELAEKLDEAYKDWEIEEKEKKTKLT